MNPSTARPERARSSISRRAVVVGTAWAVPAIVVASAAPALAASLAVTITQVCRVGDVFTVTLKVTGTAGSTVTVNSVTVDNVMITANVPVIVGVGGSTTVNLPTVTVPKLKGRFSVSVATSAGTATASVVLNNDGCVAVP